MVLGPTLTLGFTMLTVVVNDWEVLSGGEPLSITIAVDNAIAEPFGGAYEKTHGRWADRRSASVAVPGWPGSTVGGNNEEGCIWKTNRQSGVPGALSALQIQPSSLSCIVKFDS